MLFLKTFSRSHTASNSGLPHPGENSVETVSCDRTVSLPIAQTWLQAKLTPVNEFVSTLAYLTTMFLLSFNQLKILLLYFFNPQYSQKEHKYKLFRAYKSTCNTGQVNFHTLQMRTTVCSVEVLQSEFSIYQTAN